MTLDQAKTDSELPWILLYVLSARLRYKCVDFLETVNGRF